MTGKVEHKDTILFLAYFPFCILICVLGIVGNFIALIVWKRLRIKSRISNITTTLYFIVLAYVDMGVLFLTPFVMILPVADKKLVNSYYYAFFVSYIGHPLHFFLVFVSIYLVMAMSVDRVRLIFRPFSRYNVRWMYTYITITMLFVITGLLNLPTFFEYEPHQKPDGNYVLKEVRYKNQTSFRTIVFATHCVGVVIIPWVVMLIANILLIMKSSNRFREIRVKIINNTEEEKSQEHRQLTNTLILVSFVTLVLLAVQCIARCVTMFHYIDDPMWDQIHFARELGNLGLPLNSALNFFLFCLPGKKFRKEFRLLYRRCLCVKNTGNVVPIKSPATNLTIPSATNGNAYNIRSQNTTKTALTFSDGTNETP